MTSDSSIGVSVRLARRFRERNNTKWTRSAARTAASIADSSKEVEPVELKLHDHPNHYAIKTPWEEVSIDQKIPYLQKINDKVFALDAAFATDDDRTLAAPFLAEQFDHTVDLRDHGRFLGAPGLEDFGHPG